MRRNSGFDIGNNASAFVEIQVGRQASDEFKVILVASSFLSPIESRNETQLTRVRMFTAEKLNSEIAKEKLDIIKAVCTQPLNKSFKYGLSFISIHSVEEKPAVLPSPSGSKNGMFESFGEKRLHSAAKHCIALLNIA